MDVRNHCSEALVEWMSFVLFLHSHTGQKSYSVVLECILKNNYIIKDESNASNYSTNHLSDNVTPPFVFREDNVILFFTLLG